MLAAKKPVSIQDGFATSPNPWPRAPPKQGRRNRKFITLDLWVCRQSN